MVSLEQEAAYWRRVAELDENKETTLLTHAAKMSERLNEEWEVPQAVSRSWHTTYKRLDGCIYRATLHQKKYNRSGFEIGYVSFHEHGELSSGAAVDIVGAAVWLGLEEVEPGMVEWSISL
jgi:hypothetical protein